MASHPKGGMSRNGKPRGIVNGHRPSNVKHQRARATASRANGTISLRALRCMR